MPKRSHDEERDWKMTLFVWRGTLAVSDAKDSVTWEGAWEPTLNHALPSDYDYENSKNRFVLRSRAYREKDALEILEVSRCESESRCTRSSASSAETLFSLSLLALDSFLFVSTRLRRDLLETRFGGGRPSRIAWRSRRRSRS